MILRKYPLECTVSRGSTVFLVSWHPTKTQPLRKVQQLVNYIHTLMACCMKSIAISKPNNSPANRVNLLIIEQAPKIDSRISSNVVHTHTLHH